MLSWIEPQLRAEEKQNGFGVEDRPLKNHFASRRSSKKEALASNSTFRSESKYLAILQPIFKPLHTLFYFARFADFIFLEPKLRGNLKQSNLGTFSQKNWKNSKNSTIQKVKNYGRCRLG